MKHLLLTAGLISGMIYGTFSQDQSKVVLPVPTIAKDYQFNQVKGELYNLGLSSYEYKNYKDIQGSPYMSPDLKDGKIITADNRVLVGKLRYNIYTDEIEFEYKNNLLSIAKPDNFKEFYIDNQKLVYKSFVERKKSKKSFMIILEEGEYTLLVKKNIEYLNKDKQQPYSTPKPDRFEPRDDTYFLSFQNQPAHKMISLKKLTDAFPELTNTIKTYPLKSINFNNGEELIKFVQYLNSGTQNK